MPRGAKKGAAGASPLPDLTGLSIDKWLVLDRRPPPEGVSYSGRWYLCQCGCGVERVIRASHLFNARTSGCSKCSKIEPHISPGQTIGCWTYIAQVGKSKWRCQCRCGRQEIRPSAKASALGNQIGCAQCHRTKIWDAPWGDIWRALKSSAKTRGIRLSVTLGFIKELLERQNFICALSGVKVKLAATSAQHHENRETTASLDRIDSEGHYTEDNVQWVHKTINRMKQMLPEEDFLIMCKAVAEHNSPSEDYIAY